MHQRYLRVTLLQNASGGRGSPISVGPQAAQRQSGGLSLPEGTPGLSKYSCA